ncbi:MAG: DNA polymerase I [Clostridiales bacterium]|nr:DNA polymerase I [Clostridiales bacterium]
MEKLMAVDGNSILNRAFYGLQGQKILTTSGGLHTNAVYGFLNILNKFIEEEKPTYLCVAFDLKAPTFRHLEFEAYKANRKGMPEELAEQVPVMKEVLDAMGIARIELAGFEADDILGTVSQCAENIGIETIIITGDRDSLQLASGLTRIKLPITRAGRTETEEYDGEGVFSHYGVTPAQFIDVKGLMGDQSDNIPGVPGIGEKTALELIKRFGSIDAIYENLESVEKNGVRNKLSENRELAFISRRIATIDRNIPMPCGLEELKRKGYDEGALYELFRKLEFKKLIEKLKLAPAAEASSIQENKNGSDIEKNDAAAAAKAAAAANGALSETSSGASGVYAETAHGEDCKTIIITNIDELKKCRNKIIKDSKADIFYLMDKADAFTNELSLIAFATSDCEVSCIRLSNKSHERRETGTQSGMFDLLPGNHEKSSMTLQPSDNSNITVGAPAHQAIDIKEFLQVFGPVFSDVSIKKTGHDTKPLITYMKWQGISFRGLDFDTMLAAYILNPSRNSYSLSEVSAEYLQSIYPDIQELAGKGKGAVKFSQIEDERLIRSAVIHTASIARLSPLFKGMIENNAQENLYYDIELPLIEVLADMEFLGFKVRVDELKKFSNNLDAKINAVTADIYKEAGEEFNINSPKQLGVILFDKLGLPVQKKTKTGYSTDVEVLEQLAPLHGIVAGILEFRQLVKLKSTYAEGMLSVVNPATGRIHSSFNQMVAATGRISSTEPNLQNIPVKLEMGREIRKVFVPENDDYLLSGADYSQIELRILAHIAGDANMTEAFRNNEDIHTTTAAYVFNVPENEVTSLMRSRAKAVNFGIVYGIGDFSLSRDIGVTKREAKEYIDSYLGKYSGVRQYMKDTVEYGKKNGFVQTLFNRRRYLPELQSSNFNLRSFGERVAMNMPIQGSAADIIKIAMVRVYKELAAHGMKSRMILQVHDELIIETFKDEKDQVEKILKNSMENAAKLDVPLLVEVKSGGSWYETK